MGLWDFVKSAGKALGIGAAEAAEAPDPDRARPRRSPISASAPTASRSRSTGDKVVLSGAAPSQEVKEKVILAVGNVVGVAKVEEAVSTPEPVAEPVFHTVVKGDTLWKIRRKTLWLRGRATRRSSRRTAQC